MDNIVTNMFVLTDMTCLLETRREIICFYRNYIDLLPTRRKIGWCLSIGHMVIINTLRSRLVDVGMMCVYCQHKNKVIFTDDTNLLAIYLTNAFVYHCGTFVSNTWCISIWHVLVSNTLIYNLVFIYNTYLLATLRDIIWCLSIRHIFRNTSICYLMFIDMTYTC